MDNARSLEEIASYVKNLWMHMKKRQSLQIDA